MSVAPPRLGRVTTALYRRYRPETFQEVIGQEHVTEPLMAALRGERVTHAYLFSGPRGCGKTTSARILARCLNCANYPTDTPCGECSSCVDLARGGPGSLDVVEIDAASHGGVDDARELRERATFAPARDRFKIFIIDEAHMVSPQGFNALLKLVEEPPEHVKFVFATTEPEKVIGTIRSRTHHYPFRLVPPETLEHYLAALSAEEQVDIAGGVLPLVVRAGGGSVRDTLSVLDQLVAGAIDGSVDYRRAAALLGYTDAALLDDVTDAIGARDGAALFGAVDRVVQSGHDPRRFVEDLLQRLRDLVVLAMAGEAGEHALGGLPQDSLERLRGQAEHIGARRLSAVADLTNDALSEMSGATSPRLQLELLCARILLVGAQGAAPAGQGEQAYAAAPGQSQGQGQAQGHVPGAPAGAPPRLRVPDSRVRPGEQGDGAPSQRGQSEGADGQRGQGGVGAPSARAVPDDSAPVAHPLARAGGAPEGRVTTEDAPAVEHGEARPGGQKQPGAPDVAGNAPADEGEIPAGVPLTHRGEPAGEEQQGGSDRPVDQPRHEVAQEAPQQPRQADAGADAQLVQSRWEEAIGAIGTKFLFHMLKQNARPGELSGQTLRVDFANPALIDGFRARNGEEQLAQAIFETLGLRLRVVVAAGGDATPPPAAMGGWQGGGRDGTGGPAQAGAPAPQARPGEAQEHRGAAREVAPAPSPEDDTALDDAVPRETPRDDADQDGASQGDAGPDLASVRDEDRADARDSAPDPQPDPDSAPDSSEGSDSGPDVEEDDGGWPTVAIPGAGYVPEPVTPDGAAARDDAAAPTAPVPELASEPAPWSAEGAANAASPAPESAPAQDATAPGPADAAAPDGRPVGGREEPPSAAPEASSFEDAVRSALGGAAPDTGRDVDERPGAPAGADANASADGGPGGGGPSGRPDVAYGRDGYPIPEAPPYDPSEEPGEDAGKHGGAARAHSRPAPAAQSAQRPSPPQHPWEKFLPPSVQAARANAAAGGESAGHDDSGDSSGAPARVVHDDVSPDDADAEDSTSVGLPVVQELLGAVVLEEIDTTRTNDERSW